MTLLAPTLPLVLALLLTLTTTEAQQRPHNGKPTHLTITYCDNTQDRMYGPTEYRGRNGNTARFVSTRCHWL